jgi:hypothetical protein
MSYLSLIVSKSSHILFDYGEQVYEYVVITTVLGERMWAKAYYQTPLKDREGYDEEGNETLSILQEMEAKANGVVFFRKEDGYPFARRMLSFRPSIWVFKPQEIARNEYLKGARNFAFDLELSLETETMMGGFVEDVYVLYEGRYQLIRELALRPDIEDDWI